MIEYSMETTMPRQKLPLKQKDKAWREQCIDASLNWVIRYSPRRSTPQNKKINYELLNGKFNKSDFMYLTNPFSINNEELEFPATLEFMDIISPLFNLLFGEEAKRVFNPVVRVINEDAITEKEESLKKEIIGLLEQYLQSVSAGDKETLALIDEKLNKLSPLSYQDMREISANRLLKYYTKQQKTANVFYDGWLDALVAGEEIYYCSKVGNEPHLRRCNPLETFFVLPNNSVYVDEADIIVEDTYMSLSSIIDEFYDKLSEADIEHLEAQGSSVGYYNMTVGYPVLPQGAEVDNIYTLENMQRQATDRYGLRVFRVTWKSKKKIGELTVDYDDNGEPIIEIVDEFYKPAKGQEIKWFWVNEYWSGVKIHDLYLDIEPNSHQYRSMDNLSRCKSGYIGTVYNAQNSQSVSLMDRLKPWIYLYMKIWYRTELLIAANQGKIAEIDLAMIPDDWELEKWLYYATAMKFAFVNSFNEGRKGQSTGKLAGNMSGRSNTIDLETGNSIQYHITLLQFIEDKIQNTSGITKQRLGAISTSELVGNTERSVTQSSHITEKWFQVHNDCKLRALEQLIECAKACATKTKKMQYITDDLDTMIFKIDSDSFPYADYGVFITDTVKDQKALDTLENLMQMAIGQEKVELSDVIDVISTESIAQLKAKLKKSSEDRQAAAAQNEKIKNEIQMKEIEWQHSIKEKELQLKEYEISSNNQTKLEIAAMTALGIDEGANGPDITGIAEVALKQQELDHRKQIELMDLEKTREVENKKLNLENKKLNQEKELTEKQLEVDKMNMKNDVQIAKINAKNRAAKAKSTKK